MRPWILSLALLFAVTSPARAQFFHETWNERGEVVAVGNMTPDPGLEILMRYTMSTRMAVMDPPGGVIFELPPDYSQLNKLEVLVRDFDLDGLDELCLLASTPEPDQRVALFDLWPDPQSRWEICCWFAYDSARTGNFTGAGIEIILHQGLSFLVLESWTGDVVYAWHDEHPTVRVLGTQILDLDGDGREELLVQAENNADQIRSAYILEHPGAVGIETGPPLLEARPLAARNAPNPFSGPTQVEFRLPARDRVTVRVLDPAGRLVRTLVDRALDAGPHLVTWDGTDATGQAVRSGVFFCEVASGGERIARKLIRIR